ncbi:MAG: hypothetical protein FJ109_11820 [Deltaproteobacteria bacterium]|nr:hypothetical protein [Deltaproteobacteria bacterium]
MGRRTNDPRQEAGPGPGLAGVLASTSAIPACPCGSGKKHKKCCGR